NRQPAGGPRASTSAASGRVCVPCQQPLRQTLTPSVRLSKRAVSRLLVPGLIDLRTYALWVSTIPKAFPNPSRLASEATEHRWVTADAVPDGLCAEEVYARLPENHPALSSRGGLADRHDIAPPSGDEGDPDFRPTPDGFTDWPDKTLAAARAVEGTGGRLPKGATLIIDRLARPRLSWRDMLRRFVASARRSDRAWHRPNRRLAAQGLCLPGGVCFAPRLVLAIDASGSCVAHLAGFLAELRAALSSVGGDAVRVLVFDAGVHTDVVLAGADAADALAIHGGGGTDFRPVMDRLMASDPPDGLVILTDGLGRAPSTPPPFPVLWVLTPLGRTPAPWAQCVPLPPPP
ncbi:hypothetical protein DS843_30435, partial [Roseomonas genomospecies 6]